MGSELPGGYSTVIISPSLLPGRFVRSFDMISVTLASWPFASWPASEPAARHASTKIPFVNLINWALVDDATQCVGVLLLFQRLRPGQPSLDRCPLLTGRLYSDPSRLRTRTWISRCGLCEPGFEARLAESCVIARYQRSLADLRPRVERSWVSDDFAGILHCGQAPPHQIIE